MSQQWFYTRDRKTRLGPVSLAQLRALAQSGGLLPTDLVWTQGMPGWKAASEIQGLFANLESSPKPPPPPLPARDVQPPGAIAPPDKGNPREQRLGTRAKIVLIAGGATLGLFLLCCGGVALIWLKGDGNNGGGWSTRKPFEVTAKEIDNAYQANEVAADAKYKGMSVQIEGVVLSIRRNDDDGQYVEVSGNQVPDPFGVLGFCCYFDDTHKAELAKRKQGQPIAVVGILDGKHRQLRKCKFAELKPIKLELSASQFYQEAQGDALLFEKRYNRQTVTITGKLVADGFKGIAFACGAEPVSDRVRCHFKESDRALLLKQSSDGQIRTVRGIVDVDPFGGPNANVRLNNCDLLK